MAKTPGKDTKAVSVKPRATGAFGEDDARHPEQSSLFEQPLVSQSLAQPPGPAPSNKAEPDHRHGHRERLRARFRDGGPDALPDYELLEMILFRVFPRGDPKPLAKQLIAKLGSFAEVISAPEHRLREVDGIGDRAVEEIMLIRASALRLMKRQIPKRTPLSSWQTVINYLTAAQAYDQKEAFRILFLDKRNHLIADEVQSRGTVDHTPVYVREVISRALELSATSVILVHNHPSGDPTPSRADIDMTKLIAAAGGPLGVTVHDHIIVGRQGHVSMKAMRLF